MATSTSDARRDATPAVGEDLLDPLLRHRVVDREEQHAALLREPGGDVGIERRQLVEALEPEPLQELERGPVQDRATRRVRTAELDDEPAVQQAADGVVRIDAADALDRGARDRLPVGDDRKRLEARRARAGPHRVPT